MASDSDARTTTDHDEIRAWAERHDGVPATVRDTANADEPGVLTLDIVGHGADEGDLEHIGWDAWFDKFEDAELAFLYQEQKTSGEGSTFFKLIGRDSADRS